MYKSYDQYIKHLVKDLGWPEKVAQTFASYAWQFRRNKEEK